ncbi:hypothetical protein QL104_19965 [Pseudomonas piscis]|uniref:Uncharacterized protein n=1 Tax=Pseudomonas piscis TaxID=2614538 RepID=A0ABY9NAU4_9PSED|nr:hypothetical protein [Pseudomonas piscis]WMN15635.1 hypothetical protein QL104_19965 [Pseudomonas piscis]
MPHALDDRPLLVRLTARTKKYQGCTGSPLATDIALHQQSIEEINRLTAITEELVSAAQEALRVIPKIKPANHGNGTQVRLAAAIDKATP